MVRLPHLLASGASVCLLAMPLAVSAAEDSSGGSSIGPDTSEYAVINAGAGSLDIDGGTLTLSDIRGPMVLFSGAPRSGVYAVSAKTVPTLFAASDEPSHNAALVIESDETDPTTYIVELTSASVSADGTSVEFDAAAAQDAPDALANHAAIAVEPESGGFGPASLFIDPFGPPTPTGAGGPSAHYPGFISVKANTKATLKSLDPTADSDGVANHWTVYWSMPKNTLGPGETTGFSGTWVTGGKITVVYEASGGTITAAWDMSPADTYADDPFGKLTCTVKGTAALDCVVKSTGKGMEAVIAPK